MRYIVDGVLRNNAVILEIEPAEVRISKDVLEEMPKSFWRRFEIYEPYLVVLDFLFSVMQVT